MTKQPFNCTSQLYTVNISVICLILILHSILNTFVKKTGNTGFEFLVDSSSPMHYSSLSFSKPWESYRLRVLPSQSAGVTSLPYITTTTPSSSEGMPLYPSSQAVSLPGTGGPSMTELRGTSDTKVIMVNCLVTKHTISLRLIQLSII